jgi:rubredoxin
MPAKTKEKRNALNRASYARNKEKRQKKNREKKVTAKTKWREYKSTLSCVQCGQNHPATLDFHHIEKHPSNRKVNKLVTNHAFKKAAEEVKKCKVLCSNCHRIHHHNERQAKKKGAEAPSNHSTSTQSSASSSK